MVGEWQAAEATRALMERANTTPLCHLLADGQRAARSCVSPHAIYSDRPSSAATNTQRPNAAISSAANVHTGADAFASSTSSRLFTRPTHDAASALPPQTASITPAPPGTRSYRSP
jgi:hypothetical protein